MSKYEKGQQIPISGIITITGVQQNKAGNFLYSTDRSAVMPEFLIERLEMKLYENPLYAEETRPAVPKQEDKPKFVVGDKIKVVKNVTTLTPKDDYVGNTYEIKNTQGKDECKGYRYGIGQSFVVYESEVEPYTEPEQPKEPIVLYCIKDYPREGRVTKGRMYTFEDGGISNYDNGWKSCIEETFEDWKKYTFLISSCLIKTEKRPALVGEWVLLTNVLCPSDNGDGEIYKVSGISAGKPVISGKTWGTVLLHSEYLVLPDYQPEKVEPTYLNMKVVCTNTDIISGLTKGKVYSFVDGQSRYDDKIVIPVWGDKIKSLEDLNGRSGAKFIEFKGEQSC